MELKGWLEENWVKLLGYFPICPTLDRGWIIFQFSCRKDLEEVFSRAWGWGSSRLILKE